MNKGKKSCQGNKNGSSKSSSTGKGSCTAKKTHNCTAMQKPGSKSEKFQLGKK